MLNAHNASALDVIPKKPIKSAEKSPVGVRVNNLYT
jgi:hypothetical protein